MLTNRVAGWLPSLRRGRVAITFLFSTLCCFSLLAAVSQDFFPSGVFYPDNLKIDSLTAKWYSEQLTALEEPSLFEAKQDPAMLSYRFLWLRTFHRPIAVRVLIHPDGNGAVITKMADGAGGSKPGKLVVNKSELLQPDQVKKVVAKIEQLSYWTLPMRDPKSSGRDGAQWIRRRN